jgi:hypothetical protein
LKIVLVFEPLLQYFTQIERTFVEKSRGQFAIQRISAKSQLVSALQSNQVVAMIVCARISHPVAESASLASLAVELGFSGKIIALSHFDKFRETLVRAGAKHHFQHHHEALEEALRE